MVTIQVSHSDLGRYLPVGRKTGAVQIDLSSKGRAVRWLVLSKNGIIKLTGVVGSQQQCWSQTYRGHAPIDD